MNFENSTLTLNTIISKVSNMRKSTLKEIIRQRKKMIHEEKHIASLILYDLWNFAFR